MKLPPVRFTTSRDGTRLAYVVFGDGPDMLVTGHGAFGIEYELAEEMGDPYFEALGRRFHVTYFDPRGVGMSEREVSNIAVEQDAEDIIAIADASGLDRFALYGSCELGAGAVVCAARNPNRVSALIAYATVADGPKGVPLDVQETILASIGSHWAMAARTIVDTWCPNADGHRRDLLTDALRTSISAQVMAMRIRACRYGQNLTAELQQLEIPVLAMQRHDHVTPRLAATDIAALAPDSVVVPLEGVDHYQWEGDSDPVLDAIADFMGSKQIQPAPQWPSSFRTILFTDVEESTLLNARYGDARARELLQEHERLTREALAAHSGDEIKTMGDGFMVSFTSASGAIDAAIEMQRAITSHFEVTDTPVRIRVGINAGEPIAEDDDLHGTAVIQAARIMTHADGGEILVSDTVRNLVAGKDYLFSQQGEVDLKGFEEPVRLFDVRWQDTD